MSSELQSIVNAVGDLPPMPVVASRVVQLMQDPNTTADDLAKAISRDAAVTARVLKIANSSFYSLQRQVKTLEHAIVVLGQKTLRSLVLASSIKGMNRSFGLMEKMLWEDSIGCAVCARMIALKYRTTDPEEAFLAGLFRHIGKLVMNNLDPEKYLKVVQGVYNGVGTVAEMERQNFPFSHAVIGAGVLRKWQLSDSLYYAVRHHWDLAIPDPKDRPLAQLVGTVNLADKMVRHLGIGCRAPQKNLQVAQSRIAKYLGLSEEQVTTVEKEFNDAFEADRSSFVG